MSLPRAAEALERGDHATALSLTLASWTECKHPRIAAVIDALSRRVAKTRPPPGGTKLAEKQAAWLAMAAQRDPADLGHLLAALTAIKKQLELVARLTALEGRSDPRIATALHELLEHPPIPGATGRPVVRQALTMLVAIGDPRSIAALEHVEQVNTKGGGGAAIALRAALPSTQSALLAVASEPALSSEQSYLLGVIEAALAQRDPAPLFAAVYANPDDDAPRAVLADLLQELGDPRGELIALQLGSKRTREETALLKAHGRSWLGPIAPALTKAGTVFERGFLAKCRTINEASLSGGQAICAHREWATVTELDLGPWQHVEELLAAMPHLRVLRTEGNVGQLRSHLRLEQLGVKYVYEFDDSEHLATLAFPSLRSLAISWCYATLPHMRPFLDATPSLRRLSLTPPDPAAWIAWLAGRGYEHASVGESGRPWVLWIEGNRITAHFVNYGGHDAPQAGPQLAEMLAMVPQPARAHLTVKCNPSPRGTSVDAIEEACRDIVETFVTARYVIE